MLRTSIGRRGWAMATRFCTWTWRDVEIGAELEGDGNGEAAVPVAFEVT